ncbi:MAG: coproporphyrinogen dehydrogenase HemZ [Oscillospiraceae bacterium]|nr:coproporphyrinogen dehydrogenase HemZ [Oscillospiraceae bacterium]
MYLIFEGHDYQYTAEQMLFTLFPGEKPVYTPPDDAQDTLRLSLREGAQYLTATALLTRAGRRTRGQCRVSRRTLPDDPAQAEQLRRQIVQMAFYRAGVAAKGEAPPWGAMTGVRPVKIPTKAMQRGATPRQADALLRDVYRVSPKRRALALSCARESLRALGQLSPREISLYVGIPFCPTRCTYCSFVSADVQRSLQLVAPFLEVLHAEIAQAGSLLRTLGLSVRTVYIGGGTPTTLSAAQLDALLGRIAEDIDLSRCTEYTVEAGRPDTITAEKLHVLHRHGVGRVSVNPQSMSDTLLAAMGRAHRSEDVLRAFARARESGIPCVNMDVIAGLPTDTAAGFAHTMEQILALSPENITVHTLALKKGADLLRTQAQLPDGRDVAHMLDCAWDSLAAADYEPYYLYRQKYMSGSFENVGWTKNGFQSLYNLCMMEELHTVLALGGGGVTKLVDSGHILRVANPKYPYEYIGTSPNFNGKWARITAFYAGKGEPSLYGLSDSGN